MLRRAAAVAAVLAVAAAALAWFLTAPDPLETAELPTHQPDVANGELVFYAGGCTSCHAAPEAKGEDKLRLSGGLELSTDFGIFRVPNISPDPETGIGGWSTLEFVNAVMRGVSPGGDIFIHGLPNGTATAELFAGRDWTDGCIAVTNEEIREIWAMVKDGTPIEIRP